MIVQTVSRNPLEDANWVENDAGFHVSTKFGFGVIDAEVFISVAKHWQTVPDQQVDMLQRAPNAA